MRDNLWLKKELEFLLKNYFSDIKITNPIEIVFGREAKYRFGSIRLIGDKGAKRARGAKGWREMLKLKGLPKKSVIVITRMFADEAVPAHVVQYTIAHELCHYHHGFSSANKRLFKYPHHGGVVNQELKDRGAGELITGFKKWLRSYRKEILNNRS